MNFQRFHNVFWGLPHAGGCCGQGKEEIFAQNSAALTGKQYNGGESNTIGAGGIRENFKGKEFPPEILLPESFSAITQGFCVLFS